LREEFVANNTVEAEDEVEEGDVGAKKQKLFFEDSLKNGETYSRLKSTHGIPNCQYTF
jgi:hypothetical protein